MLYASRGTVKPTIRAPAAYDNGMRQAVTWELRKLRAIYLLIGRRGILKLQHRKTNRCSGHRQAAGVAPGWRLVNNQKYYFIGLSATRSDSNPMPPWGSVRCSGPLGRQAETHD